jgi:hypothetical protein
LTFLQFYSNIMLSCSTKHLYVYLGFLYILTIYLAWMSYFIIWFLLNSSIFWVNRMTIPTCTNLSWKTQ